LRLAWVELRDFRNHEHTRVEDLPEGTIAVVGPNGEGKTNLLEGMAFLFLLASPRTASAEPIVRRGAAGSAYARGEVETAAGGVLVEVEIPARGASRVQANRSPVRRKRELRRQVRAVFFGPDDLAIVMGDPGRRREFLDEVIRALWPLKEGAIGAYDRALRQRNRLLKEHEGAGTPPGLDTWDEQLAAAGVELMALRAEAVRRLGPPAGEEYARIAGYELNVAYAPNVEGPDPAAAFAERLAARRADELVRRTTLVGPHRDELALSVRDLRARGFASHGEAWAAAVCLRLGVAAALREEVGEAPVVLLDDPLSALDPVRQRRVQQRLEGLGQVVVSVADPSHVPPGSRRVLEVTGGRVGEA
jgi:DNA replication and repair protein RecF